MNIKKIAYIIAANVLMLSSVNGSNAGTFQGTLGIQGSASVLDADPFGIPNFAKTISGSSYNLSGAGSQDMEVGYGGDIGITLGININNFNISGTFSKLATFPLQSNEELVAPSGSSTSIPHTKYPVQSMHRKLMYLSGMQQSINAYYTVQNDKGLLPYIGGGIGRIKITADFSDSEIKGSLLSNKPSSPLKINEYLPYARILASENYESTYFNVAHLSIGISKLFDAGNAISVGYRYLFDIEKDHIALNGQNNNNILMEFEKYKSHSIVANVSYYFDPFKKW